MSLRRLSLMVGPALLLAALGLTHPKVLNSATASWWTTLHVLVLPVFPLLALSLWLLLDGLSGVAAWVARVAGYVYAAFYTALDVLAGIATGTLVGRGADPDGAEVGALFEIGNRLGDIGAWSFLAACLAATIALYQRGGRAVLPGAIVLVAAAFTFTGSHIYWPTGVSTMLGLAAGLALLAMGRTRATSSPAPLRPPAG
jgi:hypothetical protein